MRVVSLNAGMPRPVAAGGEVVQTGIYKRPVEGLRAVSHTQIDGDGQADLEAHGGIDKAVYGYPAEHYALWHAEQGLPLEPWGLYGENLTTMGLLESELCIGDRLRAGTVLLEVSQPRVPCFKLALRLGRPDFPKSFLASGRSGFYFRVVEPGMLGAGSPIALEARGAGALSVAEAHDLGFGPAPDRARIAWALELPALSEAWRQRLRKRLGV